MCDTTLWRDIALCILIALFILGTSGVINKIEDNSCDKRIEKLKKKKQEK